MRVFILSVAIVAFLGQSQAYHQTYYSISQVVDILLRNLMTILVFRIATTDHYSHWMIEFISECENLYFNNENLYDAANI
jgi:hypothetical protein